MIPSAAPYSVTWNTERQVTTEKPAKAGFFLLQGCTRGMCRFTCFRIYLKKYSIKSTRYENLWHNASRNEAKGD